MGGRQIRPARVYQTMTAEMDNAVLAGRRTQRPPWYNVLSAVPPAETLIRTIPPQHQVTNRRAKKPKNLFRPQPLIFLEDGLRDRFYKDHPWELARPRIIMELDGKDSRRCDWSKGLRQPGVALTGECVVQRQMWLMHNSGLTQDQAYDKARRELYRLRQEEEVERRVALEEARHVGAYFGRSRLNVGMILEDQEFETWKVWAAMKSEAEASAATKEIDNFGLEDENKPVDAMDGPPLRVDDLAPTPVPGEEGAGVDPSA